MACSIIFDIDSLTLNPNLNIELLSKSDADIITNNTLLNRIFEFCRINQERCCILTKYPLEIIMPIIKFESKIQCVSSSTVTEDGVIVPRLINKSEFQRDSSDSVILVTGKLYSHEYINMGDYVISYGMNDDSLSTELLRLSTHAIYNEEKLCQTLQQLL